MTAPYLDSMRLDERYADAAARAESLSNQLADLRDVFEFRHGQTTRQCRECYGAGMEDYHERTA